MHMGGGFSNAVVRSALPSAGGQGVSPVILAPAGTGAGAVVLVAFAAVVVVVEDDLALLLSLLETPVSRARPTMTAAMTTPTMTRLRVCRYFWARRIASCRD